MLGDAYEYLIKQFADDAGKKGGEFYTPKGVVQLVVELLDPQLSMSVYDPTCGSGGMLESANHIAKLPGPYWAASPTCCSTARNRTSAHPSTPRGRRVAREPLTRATCQSMESEYTNHEVEKVNDLEWNHVESICVRFCLAKMSSIFVAKENVYFVLQGKPFALVGLYSFPLRSVGKYLVNDASNLVALRVKIET
jgi:N-6 DNA Methylase